MPNTKHILVIEVNPEEADLFQLMIEKCMPDAKVWIAHQEETALMCLAASRPRLKLILLDLYLPNQSDGLQLLSRFKAHFKIHKQTPIPIIVLANSTNNKDILACYQLGANAYIIKPNSYQGLLDLCSLLKTYWFDTVTLPGS